MNTWYTKLMPLPSTTPTYDNLCHSHPPLLHTKIDDTPTYHFYTRQLMPLPPTTFAHSNWCYSHPPLLHTNLIPLTPTTVKHDNWCYSHPPPLHTTIDATPIHHNLRTLPIKYWKVLFRLWRLLTIKNSFIAVNNSTIQPEVMLSKIDNTVNL